MPPLTDEQRETFLDLTRRGWNRGAAAAHVGTTGTAIRRLVDESTVNHDPEFAAAYRQALAEMEPDGTAPPASGTPPGSPRTHTSRGMKRWSAISQEERAEFLELVSGGEPRFDAARSIGTSLHQINSLATNDPEFARELKDAYEQGYPIFVDRMRSLAVKQAEGGDYRALRDILIVHAEEYGVLRTTRHEVGGFDGGAIQIISEVFPSLPSHVLDGLIEAIEQKQIDPANVIDMIPARTGTDG